LDRVLRAFLESGSRTVIGRQRWDQLLFLHWPVAPEVLRRRVDARLALDLFEGHAWISLTPFTVRGARLRALPPLPFLSTFPELNFRTYVRPGGGMAGIWFFSLDAAAALASAVARLSLGLPYFSSRIRRHADGARHDFECQRLSGATRPRFQATWRVGPAPVLDPAGSLEHFLVERYALYTTLAGRLLRVRVRHPPWVLHEALVERLEQTVTEAIVPSLPGAPLAQFSDGVEVDFFPPERLG
jgi:uncharacterized protein YqjF (DUF2071 family)